MPERFEPVSPIHPPLQEDVTGREALDIVNTKIDEINRTFENFNEQVRQLRGDDGQTIQLFGPVDLQGNALVSTGTKVGPDGSKTIVIVNQEGPDGSVPPPSLTIREIIAAVRADILANSIQVPFAIEPEDAVPLGQLEIGQVDIPSSAVTGGVSQVRDGQLIDLRDADGTRGGTGGVLLMVRDSDNRARPVTVPDLVQKSHTSLLEMILETLTRIEEKLDASPPT
jgi:hypothetical protein